MVLTVPNQLGVSQERIDRTRYLREQGLTQAQIGVELGVCQQRISVYLLYSGWVNPNSTKVKIVQARNLHYKDKLSYRKVAKAMGISKSYAHQLVHDPFRCLR